MESTNQILQWAEERASALEQDMHWETGEGDFGGWWAADDKRQWSAIRARATSAMDFLDRVAGTDSQWAKSALSVFQSSGDSQSMESGARAIAPILREWAKLVESGQIRPRTAESAGLREVAATDLMGQVRVLNEERGVSPAASIVLAGAALEIALRSAVVDLGLEVEGRDSITNYAKTLRRAEFLTSQDMKDIDTMAGLRNDAAHGKHETLSAERAGLMEQHVNLFLRRLADVRSTDASIE